MQGKESTNERSKEEEGTEKERKITGTSIQYVQWKGLLLSRIMCSMNSCCPQEIDSFREKEKSRWQSFTQKVCMSRFSFRYKIFVE